MNEASRIRDLTKLLVAPLAWEVDPEEVGWLRAEFEGEYVYMRINNFPDFNLYSLWLGDGKFLELEDLSATWSRRGPLEWPASAKPSRHKEIQDFD